MLHDAIRGLRLFAHAYRDATPAAHRLAFRELGLVIGMEAAGHVPEIQRHRAVADNILRLWSRPDARQVETWTEHRDINPVMLAVALEPEGYLAV